MTKANQIEHSFLLGTFRIAGGSPQTISIIGQDNSNLQTGLPVTLTVQPGANDARAVSTCFSNASD